MLMQFVPNALTIARIAMTPVLLFLLFSGTLMGQVGALALFVLAAISDYLDGKLARSLEVHSRLGHFLDPIADKVLVLGTFAALAFLIPEIVPWWAVAIIALRDVVVTALRMWAESQGRTLRTIPMAKLKTTLQLIFLIGVLGLLALQHIPGMMAEGARWVLVSPLLYVLLLAVVALTVYTGVWYLLNKDYVAPVESNG